MYRSIFDYKREFRVLHSILARRGATSVLELGCGAGNLAPFFLEAGYRYAGMDIAQPMLRIARSETPAATFMRGDMRSFSLRTRFDAVVIAGRSFAYLTTNRDVLGALGCIGRALKPRGVLIFDNFDAAAIFPNLSKPVRDRVRAGAMTVTRASQRSLNLKTGWTWNWDAEYIVEEGGRKQTLRDRAVLRAFTRDELRLLLELAGFGSVRFRKGAATFLAIAESGKTGRRAFQSRLPPMLS